VPSETLPDGLENFIFMVMVYVLLRAPVTACDR